jgi:predicted permease
MYSVLYAVVLQPLPFSQPDRLVAIFPRPLDIASLPTIQDWQRRTHAFQSIAAFTGWSPRIESSSGKGAGVGAGVGHANAVLVSQNFLSTLGIRPALGNDFAQTGNEADCGGRAIVSDAYWRRLGGGSSLAGRTLRLDHNTYVIAGVLAANAAIEGQDSLNEPSIFTPIGCDPAKGSESRGNASFQAIGRLRPSVSIKTANAELTAAQRNLSRDYPTYYPADFRVEISPLSDAMTGTATRSALFATMAACGMLLLISCSNLTNLLLARNTRRRSEFALRTTLGATPRHLLRQMLVENGLLAIMGSAAGVGLSALLVRAASHVTVVHLPRLADARINAAAMAFAAVITLLVALLLTVVPAARSFRADLLADLTRGSARSNSASTGLRKAGRLLVASQLAMALILVASAGWMVSSVLILLHQPLGFEPDHLLIASTDLRGPNAEQKIEPATTLAVLNGAMEDLRVLPGVAEVAAANDKPLGGRTNRYSFCSDLHPENCKQMSFQAPDLFLTTPEYFRTIGQSLLRGRDFNSADDGRNHVAIVNHALAVQQWPGESPIGHRIFSGDLHAWATVVGEVADVHSYSLEREPVPNLYLPEADGPDTSMTLMVRTHGDPALMNETIRRTLRGSSHITVRYVESMPELMANQVALRRFSMWIATTFGCLALSLAILGTYGLIAYEVSLREREIGIRLALGSSRPAIVTLLLRQESRWILGGMTAGMAGAMVTGFLLRAQFFHTGAASFPVLAASLLLLTLPALAAVALPGRRASMLDPAVTLRRE